MSGRMPPGKRAFIYLTPNPMGDGARQPAPGDLRQEGRECAAADRVDEWMAGFLTESTASRWSRGQGRSGSGALADAGEKEQQQKVAEEFKTLLDRLEEALGEGSRRFA